MATDLPATKDPFSGAVLSSGYWSAMLGLGHTGNGPSIPPKQVPSNISVRQGKIRLQSKGALTVIYKHLKTNELKTTFNTAFESYLNNRNKRPEENFKACLMALITPSNFLSAKTIEDLNSKNNCVDLVMALQNSFYGSEDSQLVRSDILTHGDKQNDAVSLLGAIYALVKMARTEHEFDNTNVKSLPSIFNDLKRTRENFTQHSGHSDSVMTDEHSGKKETVVSSFCKAMILAINPTELKVLDQMLQNPGPYENNLEDIQKKLTAMDTKKRIEMDIQTAIDSPSLPPDSPANSDGSSIRDRLIVIQAKLKDTKLTLDDPPPPTTTPGDSPTAPPAKTAGETLIKVTPSPQGGITIQENDQTTTVTSSEGKLNIKENGKNETIDLPATQQNSGADSTATSDISTGGGGAAPTHQTHPPPAAGRVAGTPPATKTQGGGAKTDEVSAVVAGKSTPHLTDDNNTKTVNLSQLSESAKIALTNFRIDYRPNYFKTSDALAVYQDPAGSAFDVDPVTGEKKWGGGGLSDIIYKATGLEKKKHTLDVKQTQSIFNDKEEPFRIPEGEIKILHTHSPHLGQHPYSDKKLESITNSYLSALTEYMSKYNDAPQKPDLTLCCISSSLYGGDWADKKYGSPNGHTEPQVSIACLATAIAMYKEK